jgi:hypothetical protein
MCKRDRFRIEEGADDNAVTIDSAGKVRIGTSAPSLHFDDGNGTPSTDTFVLNNNSGSSTFDIWEGDNEVSVLVIEDQNVANALYIDGGSNAGNIGMGTSSPSVPLHVFRDAGVTAAGLFERTGGSTAGRRMLHLRNNGVPLFRLEDTSQPLIWDFRLINGGFAANWTGASGAEMVVENNGTMTIKGTYETTSSRTVKRDISALDEATVLAKLEELPVHEWSYKSSPETRRVGPMAEDFHAVFRLGSDDKHLAPTDVAGVSLAAVKALKKENEAKDQRITELEARLTRLERKLSE